MLGRAPFSTSSIFWLIDSRIKTKDPKFRRVFRSQYRLFIRYTAKSSEEIEQFLQISFDFYFSRIEIKLYLIYGEKMAI